MEELYFKQNQLDHFPKGIGAMSKLRILDLPNNQLTTLVREVGWCAQSLRKLNVSYNKLSNLPGELTFLNRAIDIDLTSNPLTTPFVQWYEDSIVTLMDNLVPFLKAYPPNCVATGDAVTYCVAGSPQQFMIQAIDKEGGKRCNGGDEFEVVYSGTDRDGKPVEQKAVVRDNKDGTYTAFYNHKISGKFVLDISDCGLSIKGCPCAAYVAPGPADPDTSGTKMLGQNYKVGSPVEVELEAKDKWNNKHDKGGEKWEVTIRGPNGSNPRALVQDKENGIYVATFTPGWGGQYICEVKIRGVEVTGSPLSFNVSD
eukprot:TRINITY_DN5890_c0_g1_i1.p1 TRINITY_DN5890_c0_g1~~TRINITY_DN5890_c0_g1_i1.p1  ORF type:complete len:354 (+),score=71.37 TRINITY_DN5890_c0_g1_i1:125-1063(+)